MSIHVIVVCHKIFADRKQNCDTEYAKKSFCWPEVFDYHLACCGKHQNLNNCLCGMLAEHFYKFHAYYQRQSLGKESAEKFCIHGHNRSICNLHDQPEACQCDHQQNYHRKSNFRVT